MRIKNNFDIDIKPWEWIFIVAAFIIIILAIRGDNAIAIQALTEWIKSLKPQFK